MSYIRNLASCIHTMRLNSAIEQAQNSNQHAEKDTGGFLKTIR